MFYFLHTKTNKSSARASDLTTAGLCTRSFCPDPHQCTRNALYLENAPIVRKTRLFPY